MRRAPVVASRGRKRIAGLLYVLPKEEKGLSDGTGDGSRVGRTVFGRRGGRGS